MRKTLRLQRRTGVAPVSNFMSRFGGSKLRDSARFWTAPVLWRFGTETTRLLWIAGSEIAEGRKAPFSFLRFIPDSVSGGFSRKGQIVTKVFRQVEVFYVTIDEQNRGNGLF